MPVPPTALPAPLAIGRAAASRRGEDSPGHQAASRELVLTDYGPSTAQQQELEVSLFPSPPKHGAPPAASIGKTGNAPAGTGIMRLTATSPTSPAIQQQQQPHTLNQIQTKNPPPDSHRTTLSSSPAALASKSISLSPSASTSTSTSALASASTTSIMAPNRSSLPSPPVTTTPTSAAARGTPRPKRQSTTGAPATSTAPPKSHTTSPLRRTASTSKLKNGTSVIARPPAAAANRHSSDIKSTSSSSGGGGGGMQRSSVGSFPSVKRLTTGVSRSSSTNSIGPNGLSRSRSAKEKDALAKGNVLVSVRIRPEQNGSADGRSGEWYVDGQADEITFHGKDGGVYHYDNVFNVNDENRRVYDRSAKRLVRRVMEGYHATVFAYGMTGTGKTFSMQGTATSPGVIPLAITDIFSYIRETPHREFLLRVSYLEIYNEKINDLLSASVQPTGPGSLQQPPQEEIKLREDSKRGVYATPLKEEIVQSPTQLLRVIARGDLARRSASTQFNARSSRSHAVVQIVVESRERISGEENGGGGGPPPPSGRGAVRVSTLSLIDLAGSERAADSKERRTEGAHINKSLLTLGTVISKLSEHREKNDGQPPADVKHLPYRDSKLTRLLQPALSGNSLISILCTISIAPPPQGSSTAVVNTHTLETLNTLKFASRAKNSIVSHAKKAEEMGGGGCDAGSRALLERYRSEIRALKEQLDLQAKMHDEKELLLEEQLNSQRLTESSGNRHEEQVLEMQLARTALKERIDHLNRLILDSKSNGVNSRTNPPTNAARSSTASYSNNNTTTNNNNNNNRNRNSRRTSTSIRHSLGLLETPGLADEDVDDTLGEFADGMASLQMQVNALQADLTDKTRYISTLERRLLQARRSSHSVISTGVSHLKSSPSTSSTNNSPSTNANANANARASSPAPDNPSSAALAPPTTTTAITTEDFSDPYALIRDRDMEISLLRLQLDDKDRMVSALRSAARQRDLAQQIEMGPMESLRRWSMHSGTTSTGTGGGSGSYESPPHHPAAVERSGQITPASSSTTMWSPVSPSRGQFQVVGKGSPDLGNGGGRDVATMMAEREVAMHRKGKPSINEVSRILDSMVRERSWEEEEQGQDHQQHQHFPFP